MTGDEVRSAGYEELSQLLLGGLREAIIDAWVKDRPPYPSTSKFSPEGTVFPVLDQ